MNKRQLGDYIEEARTVELNSEYMNAAIEAATEEAAAGRDEQSQLEIAMQVYLYLYHEIQQVADKT